MITYIITPYNRSRQTYYTLARLGTLTLPDEVMVINDGWTDELDDFLARGDGTGRVVGVGHEHGAGLRRDGAKHCGEVVGVVFRGDGDQVSAE